MDRETTLENTKRDLEAKLDAPVSKEELAIHKKAILELKDAVVRNLIVLDPKASKEDKKKAEGAELRVGEIGEIKQELSRLAAVTSALLGPEKGDPVALKEWDTYTPEKGSGLKIRQQEGEGGKLVSTVELIPENPEWLDEQGRRKTERDFPDKAAYQEFLNETKEFDANQKKGKAQLAELRKKQKELSDMSIFNDTVVAMCVSRE